MDIGIDTIEIHRIERALDRYGQRFISRLFTKDEQVYCDAKANSAQYYAVRFAAKEAVYKALPESLQCILFLKDIEVIKHASGKPGVCFSIQDKRLDSLTISLSLSHSQTQATAVALCQFSNPFKDA